MKVFLTTRPRQVEVQRNSFIRPHTTQVGPSAGNGGIIFWLVVVALYLLLAMAANIPAWLHGFTHELPNEGGDIPLQTWSLAVTPYALLHGQNPFVTNYINYPGGVNLVANTTMFLPAVLLAPITLIWGAVATFNVLMVLAIAGSAISAFVAFRRWVSWTPAAFIGGLLYGFSPYMVGAAYGHLYVLLVVFPPLLLLVLDDILIRQPGRPLHYGLLLGFLATAQFFTSSEILASSAVMAGCAVLVLVVWKRRLVKEKLAYAVKAFSTALAVFIPLCAYPIWVLVAGPAHISGPVHPPNFIAAFSSDVLGSITPTSNQAIAPSSLQHLANAFVLGDLSENASYIGVSLILVSLFLVIRYRRQKVMQFAFIMAVIAYVLSLGPRLRADGHELAVRLPFVVFKHLPLLDNMLPVRYMLFLFLFGGLILGVGLSSLHREWRRAANAGTWPVVAPISIAAFALIPVIPHWPYPETNIQVPPFFRTNAVHSVPTGSVLLPYPFVTPFHDDAMIWQSDDGFRYRMPGGYVIIPGANGTADLETNSTTQNLLEYSYSGTPLPALSRSLLCAVDQDLHTWRIETIVITNEANPAEAVRLFDAALDTTPQAVSGTYVYHDVKQSVVSARAALGCIPTTGAP